MCNSKRYPCPPYHGGHFALDPPPPLEFPFMGVLVILPPPPSPTRCNFRNFSTWLGTLWKEYLCKKKLLQYILLRKIIFLRENEKNIFIYVNTVSDELKGVLS